jgi:hypothetical protein
LIKKSNPAAKVILMDTWARAASVWPSDANSAWYGANPDEMQSRIDSSFNAARLEVDRENGGNTAESLVVAPAGDAWRANNDSLEPVQLFQSDGSHPSLAGSYLSGLVLFKTIYGGASADVLYGAGLPSSTVTSLKKLI